MAKRTKSKALDTEFTMFDVVYEDGSRTSNRRAPTALLGGLDGTGFVLRCATGTGDTQRADQFGVGKQRHAATEQQQFGQGVKVGRFRVVAGALGK